MSSGLDWERFGVITGGDEVCILPPPTCLKKGWVYPLLSISQINIFRSAFVRENLVSRDGFGPSRPASSRSFSALRLNLVIGYSRDSLILI